MPLVEKIKLGLAGASAGVAGALVVFAAVVGFMLLFGGGFGGDRTEAFFESDRCRDLGARMATAGLWNGDGRFAALPRITGDNGESHMRYSADSYAITLDWLNECHKGPYEETLALIQIVQARQTNTLLQALLERRAEEEGSR